MTSNPAFVLHDSGFGYVRAPERPPVSHMLADLFEAAYRQRLVEDATPIFPTPEQYERVWPR